MVERELGEIENRKRGGSEVGRRMGRSWEKDNASKVWLGNGVLIERRYT